MESDRKQCVLVMDDSILALEFTRDALEAAGFDVLVASNAAELAEQLTADVTIDLIIMDVQMPGALGDSLARGLRSEQGVHIPIMLCSGHDEGALAERARNAQIDCYISKQAGVDAMVEQVRRLLSQAPASA